MTTPAGINDELHPILRMTVPPAMRTKTIDDLTAGTHVGRSWLLLFGLLPVGCDRIHLAELEARRFREESRMTGMSRWSHDRRISPEASGCSVRDRVEFELRGPFARVPGLQRAFLHVLRAFFQHRHRRLARWCG